MGSDNNKPFSKLGPKAQLEAVKARQMMHPQVVIEIKVMGMDNGQVVVSHPDTDDSRAIGQFIGLLATAIQTLCSKKLMIQEPNLIIPVKAGTVPLQG